MGNTYIHDGTGRHPFGTLECTRCGAVSSPIHGRIEADALVRRIEAFDAEHTACPNHTPTPMRRLSLGFLSLAAARGEVVTRA